MSIPGREEEEEGALVFPPTPLGFFFGRGGGRERVIFSGLFLFWNYFFGVWLETSLTHPYFLKEEAVRNT